MDAISHSSEWGNLRISPVFASADLPGAPGAGFCVALAVARTEPEPVTSNVPAEASRVICDTEMALPLADVDVPLAEAEARRSAGSKSN